MYYSTCDRVESNIEELPDDGVPLDLHFRDLDEQLPTGNVNKQMFVDWLTLGRHDCDVARALGYAWTEKLKGNGNETLGEFFDRLLIERAGEKARVKLDRDGSGADTDDDQRDEDGNVVEELTVPWLAKFFMSVFETDKAPFKLEGNTIDDMQLALCEKIAQEIQSVEGYASTWRASGVMGAIPTQNVEQNTREHVKTHLHAWPRILEEPTRERADGRFVKAFPLVFPMGVADLYQPRLRSDFTTQDAVQHLFRYCTGHLHRANDGNRATWALFNTALREASYEKGGLVHKNTHETVLTKAELRTLYETRQDLVARVSSFGAEIPTTSMHWKRESHDLEWIVRQMSWTPPWTPCDPRGTLDEHPALLEPSLRQSRVPAEEPVTVGDAGADVDSTAAELSNCSSGEDDEPPDDKTSQSALQRGENTGASFSSASVTATSEKAPMSATSKTAHPREVWKKRPAHVVDDTYGYNRIPAFCRSTTSLKYTVFSAPLKN